MAAKKQASKRRGKVTKKGDDGAAAFEAGEAAGPKEFDPGAVADELGCWWQSGKDAFLMRDECGRWHQWSQQSIIDAMRHLPGRMIAIKARENEMLSEAKRVLLWIRMNRAVDSVMVALPGYQSGIYDLPGGERVLVKTSPERVDPAPGDWPIIRQIVEGLLGPDENDSASIDQTPWFWSLCKCWYRSFLTGSPEGWKQNHAVVFTGTHGCGKNLVQELILTPLIGGRYADPLKFLMDEDQFNGDMMVEHWLLSEIPSSQRTEDRVKFAERIKQIVANRTMRARLMRSEPSTIQPLVRLSISVNDDADTLRSLPVVTDGYGDKIIIFHCKKRRLPILGDNDLRTTDESDTDDSDEWGEDGDDSFAKETEIRRVIAAELPAFAYWLKHEWKIPEDLVKPEHENDNPRRFGFRSFHHPVIKQQLFDETSAAQLLRLIDMAEFQGRKVDDVSTMKLWELPEPYNHKPLMNSRWWGTAEYLQQLLTGETDLDCNVVTMAKKLFDKNKRESMLTKLAADEQLGGPDGRVYKDDKDTRTRLWRGWWISRPPEQ
jgi:hypothetical protein